MCNCRHNLRHILQWIRFITGVVVELWQHGYGDPISRSTVWLYTLQWCHNEPDGVSNHRRLDCLLNHLSGADQRKYQGSASLAFVMGIHRWPVDSPHKGPVTWKMFPFDDVIISNPNIPTHWRFFLPYVTMCGEKQSNSTHPSIHPPILLFFCLAMRFPLKNLAYM